MHILEKTLYSTGSDASYCLTRSVSTFCTQLAEDCETSDPNKSAGLSKKMKAISLTMRRKMCKQAKSLSEKTVSHWTNYYQTI